MDPSEEPTRGCSVCGRLKASGVPSSADPMANLGSVVVAMFAILIGLAVGGGGVLLMLEAGSFADASSSQSSGLLGLGSSSEQSASVGTPAWVGLLLAIVGAAVLVFGLRALFVTFEGRGEA